MVYHNWKDYDDSGMAHNVVRKTSSVDEPVRFSTAKPASLCNGVKLLSPLYLWRDLYGSFTWNRLPTYLIVLIVAVEVRTSTFYGGLVHGHDITTREMRLRVVPARK